MADYDLVVVGLGAFGSSAVYQAVARGVGSVAGFEQFEFGHGNGASEDHTRIIRRSYHDTAYVALAAQAYDEWAVLEAASGRSLVVRSGGLDFYPVGTESTRDAYRTAMDRCGVGYELLDPDAVRRRWPQFALAAGTSTVFQEDGGLVAASLATKVLRQQALAGGAQLTENMPVKSVVASNGEFLVVTDSGRHRAGALIITADAWTNDLLVELGVRVNLEVRQEQVMYFPTSDSDQFAPGQFPIWIWNDDPGFYGLPDFEGKGLKIGQDVGGHIVTPATRTFRPDAGYTARATEFLRSLVPSGWREPATVKTCLYTLTPDREFVVDLVPGHPRAALALGAAHGFKFAPVIGGALVDLVTGKDPNLNRQLFAASRPVLTMDDPPLHYMV